VSGTISFETFPFLPSSFRSEEVPYPISDTDLSIHRRRILPFVSSSLLPVCLREIVPDFGCLSLFFHGFGCGLLFPLRLGLILFQSSSSLLLIICLDLDSLGGVIPLLDFFFQSLRLLSLDSLSRVMTFLDFLFWPLRFFSLSLLLVLGLSYKGAHPYLLPLVAVELCFELHLGHHGLLIHLIVELE
jgi:hypothetical protein